MILRKKVYLRVNVTLLDSILGKCEFRLQQIYITFEKVIYSVYSTHKNKDVFSGYRKRPVTWNGLNEKLTADSQNHYICYLEASKMVPV